MRQHPRGAHPATSMHSFLLLVSSAAGAAISRSASNSRLPNYSAAHYQTVKSRPFSLRGRPHSLLCPFLFLFLFPLRSRRLRRRFSRDARPDFRLIRVPSGAPLEIPPSSMRRSRRSSWCESICCFGIIQHYQFCVSFAPHSLDYA